MGAYTVALAADDGVRVAALASAGDEAFLRSLGGEVIARGEDAAGPVTGPHSLQGMPSRASAQQTRRAGLGPHPP